MVLVALLLVVLMTFAAFAVDLGAAYNERAQDQSAADAAALGAAAKTSNSAAVTEAIALSRLDVGSPPSVGDWNAAFASCVDPGRSARGFTVTTGTTDCVSFNSNGQRVRVRIPNIAVRTIFSGVLGIKAINTSAVAEAGLRLDQSGDVLPYGLPGSDAQSNEVCVKIGSNPNSPAYVYAACTTGPSSGNFRRLDITLFGNADLGTTRDCTGSADSRVAINTALGVDHGLSLHPTGVSDASNVVDLASCNASNFRLQPNIVATQTGNANTGLNEGMYGGPNVGGVTGLWGRLARGTNRITVRTDDNQMDNTPPWVFIRSGRLDIPPSCKRETFDNSKTDLQLVALGVAVPIPWRSGAYPVTSLNESKAHMSVCMTDYRSVFGDTRDPGEPMLFDLDTDGNPTNRHYDIMDAPRFGFVPESWSTTLGSGTSDFYIKRFKPLYLMTSYFKCSALDCDIVHTAGYVVGSGNTSENIGVPSGPNKSMDAVSGLLFTDSMLPPEIIEDAPGKTKNLHLELLR